MSQITTHVLDTSRGIPAQGITISLHQNLNQDWHQMGAGITDSDGRISDLLAAETRLAPGTYRLTFELAAYFKAQGMKVFYPEATIVFQVSDDAHYHIPLLLNPFGYSTYRGS